MNGKFSKVKKVLIMLVCACMLTGSMGLGAFAADIAPEAVVYSRPEVTGVEANQIGKNYVYVTITAPEALNDQPVIVYLTDGAGNLVTLGYAPVNAGGATVKLGVPDSASTAEYTIIVAMNKTADVAKSKVFYIGVEDVDGLFEAINMTGEDADQTKAKLDSHYEALAVIESTKDTKLTGNTYKSLPDSVKDAFAATVLNAVNGKYASLKGDFNAENSENFIKESLVVAAYNGENGFTDKELADIIYEYAQTVGIASEEGGATIYDSIQNRDTFVKVAKTMAPTIENAGELAEVLKNASAVQVINEAHWANLVNVVKENNKVFGVDNGQLTKLLNTKSLRTIFCKKFQGTYYSVDEIQDAWDQAYKDSLKEYNKETGGGSSGGVSKPNVKVDEVSTQVSQDQNQRDENVMTKDYYIDMAGYTWASDAVLNLSRNEIVNGYGDGTFKPGNAVTRAEFMKMLVNVFGFADISATCSFADVDKDAWYYIYVASAEKLGIAQGYGNSLFGVNDFVTRQDAITLIYRAAQIKGISLDKFSSGLGNLTDRGDIAPYAVEAVQALYNTGIYLDSSDTTVVTRFDPAKYASRAYLAYILNQMYIYMN